MGIFILCPNRIQIDKNEIKAGHYFYAQFIIEKRIKLYSRQIDFILLLIK